MSFRNKLIVHGQWNDFARWIGPGVMVDGTGSLSVQIILDN